MDIHPFTYGASTVGKKSVALPLFNAWPHPVETGLQAGLVMGPPWQLSERSAEVSLYVTTTFRVTPLEQGQKSHVEISTTMHTSPGLRGLVERILVPMINPRIYQKELKLLEGVAQRRRTDV